MTESNQRPPRTTLLAPSSEAVHSQTFPIRSWTPYGLRPSGNLSTGVIPPNRFPVLALVGSNRSPHGNRRPSGPLAAFSHSCSVGNRFPTASQYCCASYQDGPTTG